MTQCKLNQILKSAGIPDVEYLLNIACIMFREQAAQDCIRYPALAKEEMKKADIIHSELEKIGYYN